jgi:N,N'-diacetyllegionaminate synthase
MNIIDINGRKVGLGHPALIIDEVGVHHNGSIERGIELIESAAAGGADVVKFQTYSAKNIVTKTAPRYWDEKLNDDEGGTQFDTFSKLDGMGIDGYKAFKKRCQELNVIFTSTPFNIPDVDILEEIGVDVYKVSSSDITYLQLLKYVASKGKPIILSTGCASIGEIEKAVDTIRKEGNNQILLQHCILQYPCDDENANLVKMQKIQQVFPDIPVGYSDHTIGITIPAMSVAMGAYSVEKHFTIDNNLPDSPDHKLSANPEQLKDMSNMIRTIEKAKGYFCNGHYPAEEAAYQNARKSLVSAVYITKGEQITADMLTAKRPGNGIYPEYESFVVGSIAKVDINEDTTITKEMI